MILFWSLLFLLTTNDVLSANTRVKRQVKGSSDCTSPNGKPGKCISIRECPTLIELLKKANRDSTAAEFLRKSRCGAYAEVCCASQDDGDTNGVNRASDPNASICGRSSVRQTNRVVGGQPADLGAWPWIAALGYTQTNNRSSEVMWRCGGSLINKRYILTAAHCIKTPQQLAVKLSVVRLGEHDLSNDTEGANHVDYGIENTIVHEGYKSQTNDIALVRVDRDVAFSDQIRPICLPTVAALRSSDYERKYPFVVGWGETNLNGPSSDVLLQVQVPVVDNNSCGQAYARHGATITGEQLCAGEAKGGKDSCRGDSGGPLMLPQTGIYYQIGIISFGYRCAEPGYPGVYTRVSSYIDWIKTNTNGMS